MKKFLIGIATGIVLAGLAGVILVFSLIRLGDRRPSVPSEAALVLSLRGEIPEKEPLQLPFPFLGSEPPLTVREVWAGLRAAQRDNRVKSLLVIADRLDVGWAKASEVRQSILDFKKSGKPVYAYLRSPGMREYYIATAADRVYASPEDLIDVKGMRIEAMFVKNTLDKLGVTVQVVHRGRYKDAGDMFTQTSMSPETRESLGALLDGTFGSVTAALAESRKRDAAWIKDVIDNGPYTAAQALKKGMVDALRYEDQVNGELERAAKGSKTKRIDLRQYVQSGALGSGGGNRIAWIVGEGAIVRGAASGGLSTDEGFTSGAFIKMLRQVREDGSIKGVILRINSPGGDAFASDEILREVELLSEEKPLVFSMSDTAASGGYYVAMTGDPILAYPNTITGSIGVLYAKVNLRGLYGKLGIDKEILARGDNAAIDSDYLPMTPEARAKIEAGIDEFYHNFVELGAKSRKMPYDKFEGYAQGRVWLGSHAQKIGIIDNLGGIDRAIEAVKREAKIGAGESVTLVPYPPKRSLLQQWLSGTNDSLVKTSAIPAAVRKLLSGFDLRVFSPGGFLKAMPAKIEIH